MDKNYKRETNRERKSVPLIRRIFRPKAQTPGTIAMPELLMPGRKSREWAESK